MPIPTGMFALPYTPPMLWSLPMILLILCELTADFLGKQWTIKKRRTLFAASLSFYVIGNAFWLYAVLSGVGLARGITIFAIAQEITAVLMGLLYFKESLTGKQKAGLLLGMFTIIVMGGT
jgi:EamA domain-containing membrane protein RarD